MAEPEDLLGKADALMARHQTVRTRTVSYADIPVLTEVVNLAQVSGDLPLQTEVAAPAPLDEKRLEALAASIRASLLATLQPEIDALIEERLTASLAPRVERMFDELRGDLQLIAREILSDAVNTAVEQERERGKSGA